VKIKNRRKRRKVDEKWGGSWVEHVRKEWRKGHCENAIGERDRRLEESVERKPGGGFIAKQYWEGGQVSGNWGARLGGKRKWYPAMVKRERRRRKIRGTMGREGKKSSKDC